MNFATGQVTLIRGDKRRPNVTVQYVFGVGGGLRGGGLRGCRNDRVDQARNSGGQRTAHITRDNVLPALVN